jgi:aquaporin-4
MGFETLPFSYKVWRAAISEFLAMALLIFVSSAGAITCLQAGFTSTTAAIALVQFICLSFFILASAPASGGHLNPAISLATMLTGFSSPVRSILYIIAQTGGAAVGSLALKVVVAEEVAELYALGGCTLKATVLSDGELVEAGIEAGPALLNEFVLTLTVLYFAFSIALDPKQFQV